MSNNYKYFVLFYSVSEALLFGAWILGHALSFVPNINLARIAAGHLFQIIDRKPHIYSAKQNRSLVSVNVSFILYIYYSVITHIIHSQKTQASPKCITHIKNNPFLLNTKT